MNHMCLRTKTLKLSFMCLMSLFLLCSTRRTVRKSLLEEVQELEARAVDPGAAVLRDASGRRYVQHTANQHRVSSATSFFICVNNRIILLIFISFFTSIAFIFLIRFLPHQSNTVATYDTNMCSESFVTGWFYTRFILVALLIQLVKRQSLFILSCFCMCEKWHVWLPRWHCPQGRSQGWGPIEPELSRAHRGSYWVWPLPLCELTSNDLQADLEWPSLVFLLTELISLYLSLITHSPLFSV